MSKENLGCLLFILWFVIGIFLYFTAKTIGAIWIAIGLMGLFAEMNKKIKKK
jgi:hypothetical protein